MEQRNVADQVKYGDWAVQTYRPFRFYELYRLRNPHRESNAS
ncbi:hypothetical protein CA85_18750 [Allorhodopirellula solitaria]|uniref:Uncharacterized protein n=1 Tax=Allorhodopirellula solitaria TaxID=2527987 RepID=A0A5C5YG97_9BACT|nr:hypothetical protein CA85_18750 [Allorhodopirellula solitaria]